MLNTRLYSLAIYLTLYQNSSRQHPMTYGEIVDKIKMDYDTEIDKKTVMRTLGDMEMYWRLHWGLEGKCVTVYLDEAFTPMELKLMLTPVLMASFLSTKACDDFLKKIGNIGDEKRIKPGRNLAKHTSSNDFLANLEIIDHAIKRVKLLSFIYNDLDETGKFVPRKTMNEDGKRFVHPYSVVCANGFYYLVGGMGKTEEDITIFNFRIDKMSDVTELEDNAVAYAHLPFSSGRFFSQEEYLKQNFKMFNSAPQWVKFRLEVPVSKKLNYYINTVWDEFGRRLEDDRIRKINDRTIEFRVRIPLDGARIFALQYAAVAQVVEPAVLRQEVQEILKQSLKKYTEN